jgi:hypothetical protein
MPGSRDKFHRGNPTGQRRGHATGGAVHVPRRPIPDCGWALEAAAEETRPEDDHKGGPDQPRDDATEAAWERALQRARPIMPA